MSFGSAGAERQALEATYEDRAEVLRAQARREGAVCRPVFVPVAQDVPCGFSRLGERSSRVGDRSGRDEAAQIVAWDAVAFLPPEVAVRPGDRLRVRRLGQTLCFEAVGMPARYETHQEVLVREAHSA